MSGSRREITSDFKPNDYYDPDVQTVKEPMRTVLEKYSNIPADTIVDHVNEVVSFQQHCISTRDRIY